MATTGQVPERDIEKTAQSEPAKDTVLTSTHGKDSDSTPSTDQDGIPPPKLGGKLGYWASKIERKVDNIRVIEARGIRRVLPEEKKQVVGSKDIFQMFALWFSINLSATNIIIGLLGPLVFSLGWVDCVCIVIFANMLSACGVSYVATFGPESGNRTLVIGRYFMGYWPSKIACIFNIIMQIGWGIIGCIITGQLLSAVNGKGLTVAVGCVIAALLIGLIATFGINIVHKVERYAYIPQLLAIMVLVGSAGKNFDTNASSIGDSSTITANRLSFFALIIASILGFSAVSADFYVYYPATFPKWITFATTWSGIWLALIFGDIVGVGIATGVANVPAWATAYETSSGALLYACYDGLGGFGGLCVVILALGSINNNAPCTYAAALSFQVLGRYAKAVPRWAWCIVITIIELVCSVAGRNNLFDVFENFLPIMNYWICPWITIALEEHLIFHKARGIKFDWTAWEDKKRLPIGFAALLAYLIGWAGSIIGMSQVWYVGPVAKKVGGFGGDIGLWLAIGFTGVTFPLFRYLELKKFGR